MKKKIIDNAKIMINTAQADFMFSPEEDQEPRFIQALLLQVSVVEGLLREYADVFNKENGITDFEKPRNLNQANRELRVSKAISKKAFSKICEYVKFRNSLVHRILENNNIEGMEKEVNDKYLEGSDIISILLK